MATRSREKSAARKANADKRPHAIARYVRISSRKVKVVIDLIRGKQVKEAQAILMYTPKRRASRFSSSSTPPLRMRKTTLIFPQIHCMWLRSMQTRAPRSSGSAPVRKAAHRASASARATSPSSWIRRSKGGKVWDKKLIRMASA